MKVRKFLKKLDNKNNKMCLICFYRYNTDIQDSRLYNIKDIKPYINNVDNEDDMFLYNMLQGKVKSIQLGTNYEHNDRFNNEYYVPVVYVKVKLKFK